MSRPTLRRGSPEHDWVTYLQQQLVAHGQDPGPVDGLFGPRTEAAVEAYERAEGLTPDGVVGRRTWAALHDESEPSATTGPSETAPPPGETGPGAAAVTPTIVFTTDLYYDDGTLRWSAGRADGGPLVAGSRTNYVGVWHRDTYETVVTSEAVVPPSDVGEGASYDAWVVLPPDVPAGDYHANVTLDGPGTADQRDVYFTVTVAPGLDLARVGFIGDPTYDGGVIRWQAGRLDRGPIPAGSHTDYVTVTRSDDTETLWQANVTVPSHDIGPGESYSTWVALPGDLPSRDYLATVQLQAEWGGPEVRQVFFAVYGPDAEAEQRRWEEEQADERWQTRWEEMQREG